MHFRQTNRFPDPVEGHRYTAAEILEAAVSVERAMHVTHDKANMEAVLLSQSQAAALRARLMGYTLPAKDELLVEQFITSTLEASVLVVRDGFTIDVMSNHNHEILMNVWIEFNRSAWTHASFESLFTAAVQQSTDTVTA